MKLDSIRRIAVVGAGTMGAGIAQVSAQAGYSTLLYDVSENAVGNARQIIIKNLQGALERGKIDAAELEKVLTAIRFTHHFDEVKADVIIEAIIENLDVKRELFTRLAAQNDENTILATNTSSIPVTQIAYGTLNPSRVVGMHFFNPAHIMKLVEVISGASTGKDIALTVK